MSKAFYPKGFYVELKNRGLIHVEGEDRYDFLQGLVSNDVHKLKEQPIIYSCLLTPQGKFLHDFFIHQGDGFLLLDCEGGERADDLYERLNRYRLRSDVSLSVEHENKVYSTIGDEQIGLADPRHYKMGRRSFEKPELNEMPFEEWDKERIMLQIPDGSRDMLVESSTLLEGNIDKINGVDWDKGCYMGQELTARMHHRDLGKKHLYTITSEESFPEPFTEIRIDEKRVGNMRSSCGNIGLAALKDDLVSEIHHATSNSIRILGL
ncbi:MAG: folate-binding protein [Pseudomonadota bacterium]